jgi:hypothetical protein
VPEDVVMTNNIRAKRAVRVEQAKMPLLRAYQGKIAG